LNVPLDSVAVVEGGHWLIHVFMHAAIYDHLAGRESGMRAVLEEAFYPGTRP
jgi:hypothetical protein